MRPVLCLVPLALMGCLPVGPGAGTAPIPPGEVRVASADATVDRLTLRLSNGDRCVALRPEGAVGNWSGVTTGEDCGYQLPYTVTYKEGAVEQRFTIEAAPAGLGPRAEVHVTDVDGVRRLFAAPLGRNVRFGPPA